MQQEFTDPHYSADSIQISSYAGGGKDSGYVVEKHAFNRYKLEDVPSVKKTRDEKLSMAPPQEHSENGVCWTTQEFENYHYVTTRYVKYRWIEWWTVNEDLQTYQDFLDDVANTIKGLPDTIGDAAAVAGLNTGSSGGGPSAADVIGLAAAGSATYGPALSGAAAVSTDEFALAIALGGTTALDTAAMGVSAVIATGASAMATLGTVTTTVASVAAPALAISTVAMGTFLATSAIVKKYMTGDAAQKVSEGWEVVATYDIEVLDKMLISVDTTVPKHPCVTPAKKAMTAGALWGLWWLWILVLIALIGAGWFGVNRLGASPIAATAPAATPTPSPTPKPASEASPTPVAARPLLTGPYSGSIVVASDPNGHAPYIGAMPGGLDVRVVRNTQTGVITVTVSGPAPFITVTSTGNYSTTSGAFTATGKGTVTSRNIPVTASFGGTLIDGALHGTLTFTGTPNGPISYTVAMTRSGG